METERSSHVPTTRSLYMQPAVGQALPVKVQSFTSSVVDVRAGLFGRKSCGMVVGERPVTIWHGCYDDGWRELIVDEAFAHP